WNLLIGADEASTGGWAPIRVPETCREVWGEADKDACFQREAMAYIASRPGKWLASVPKKLAATFGYCGAAGWYLHASNAGAFDEQNKLALGVVETAYERAVLLLALVWAARVGGHGSTRMRWLRGVVALVGAAFLVLVHAWVSYLAFI